MDSIRLGYGDSVSKHSFLPCLPWLQGENKTKNSARNEPPQRTIVHCVPALRVPNFLQRKVEAVLGRADTIYINSHVVFIKRHDRSDTDTNEHSIPGCSAS